jgi:hypothetical protein
MNMPAAQTTISRGDALDVLSQINRGDLVAKMEDGMKECAEASVRTGKKSMITITLTFDPDDKTEAMRIIPKVKTKLPEEQEKAALFFVSPEGALVH